MQKTLAAVIGILCVLFLNNCKKEDKKGPDDTATFPAILNLNDPDGQTAGFEMVRFSNGRFLALVTDIFSSGVVNRTRHQGIDVGEGTLEPLKNSFPWFQTSTPIQGGMALNIASGNTTATSVGVFQNTGDTLVQVKFLRQTQTLQTLGNVSFGSKNFILSKIVSLRSGYLLVGAVINNGQRDAYIIKYNDNFLQEWAKKLGGADNDMAMDAVELCDDNYGILAYTYSFGAGDRDVWYIKLSPNGDSLSSNTYGGAGYEEPQRIIVSGCLAYIAGHTASFGHPEHNGYLLCIHDSGTKIWENNYGTAFHDGFHALTLNAAKDGLIVTGRSMQGNSAPEDIIVVATDLNGNEQWRKIYGEKNLTEWPVSIIADDKFYYLLCNRIDLTGKYSTVFIKDKLK